MMRLLKSVVLMVVLFEGLRILLLPSYQAKSMGALMLAAGYLILKKDVSAMMEKRSIPLLPVAGILIIAGDVFYNLVIQKSDEFLGLDWMTLMLGGVLVAYNFIQARYETEARFTAIFLSLFFLTLSLPLALLSLEFGAKAASVYTEVFIAKPIALTLNTVGIEARVFRNWVYYAGKAGTIQMGMGISCSGIYSLAIFFSAFVAYVHVRYGTADRRIMVLLASGLLGTYLANLLRVFIVALTGFFYGIEALVWVHQNIGWVIFMVWVAFFWYAGFFLLEGRRLRLVFHADEGDAKPSGYQEG